ncbi:MAG: AraC family transcriptional regulator [Alistipes sp.]|nr:AraC family transcriptional regulator [Alistipes sp.]
MMPRRRLSPNSRGKGAAVAENALFTYIDSTEYDSLINPGNLPHALRRGGIFICLGGEGDVIINENKYHLSRNTMCVAFPGTIIQAFDTEEDFESYTLAIDIDFLRELNIPSANSIHISMRENPCVVLTDEELQSIMEICKMMHRKDSRTQHPYHQQINVLTLTLLCFELAGIYLRDIPVKRQPCTRQDMIFRRFMTLLATDITTSREVKYYADKLCISPKYLTIVTRQMSSRSASDWITRSAILNAKAKLATTNLTVQQISDQLNFPNPSFFGQYFLRHTGMTPKEYRRSKM